MTTTTTPAGYIATDRDGIAIYGIGETPEAAIADAREQSGDEDSEYTVHAATAALLDRVRADGGGPDVRWSLVGDVTNVNYAADHGIIGLADLDA